MQRLREASNVPLRTIHDARRLANGYAKMIQRVSNISRDGGEVNGVRRNTYGSQRGTTASRRQMSDSTGTSCSMQANAYTAFARNTGFVGSRVDAATHDVSGKSRARAHTYIERLAPVFGRAHRSRHRQTRRHPTR